MLARDDDSPLKRTPLHALHLARGGKMVPFAGYEMPVQYAAGVLQGTPAYPRCMPACSTSRIWARSRCGRNRARSRMPRWRWNGWCRRTSLRVAPGRQRYAQFTNEAGGILDDLMVANFGDHLFLVVNAACKARRRGASARTSLRRLRDRAAGRPRADRAAGAEGRIGAGEILCRRRRDEVHGCRPAPRRRHRLLRLALRLYRRGRLRDFGAGRAGRGPRGSAARPSRRAADRARRPRQPAARGRALPLRPRHRHHDHAGRGRAGMVDPEEPPQRRRARRRFPGRGKDPRAVRATAHRAAASA